MHWETNRVMATFLDAEIYCKLTKLIKQGWKESIPITDTVFSALIRGMQLVSTFISLLKKEINFIVFITAF